jgi:hypothetical protein
MKFCVTYQLKKLQIHGSVLSNVVGSIGHGAFCLVKLLAIQFVPLCQSINLQYFILHLKADKNTSLVHRTQTS